MGGLHGRKGVCVGHDARFEWRSVSVSVWIRPILRSTRFPIFPLAWQTHGNLVARVGRTWRYLRRRREFAEDPGSGGADCWCSLGNHDALLLCFPIRQCGQIWSDPWRVLNRGFRAATTALVGTDEAVGLRGRGDMFADRGGLILCVLEGRQDGYEVPCVLPS